MYLFYLDGTQLPIAPEKLQLKIKGNNKKITLINEGEVNLIKSTALTEITFDTLLPNSKYPFASYPEGFKSAEYYMSIIEALKGSKLPFRFIVTRATPNGEYLFDTNMDVTIEEYTLKEDASKYGKDIYVSIKLKQYKAYGTKKLVIETTKNTDNKVKASVETKREVKKVTAKSYTVKKGDTLWAICKKELGNGAKYNDIAKVNGINNPNLIYPGQVIKFE